MKPKVPKVRAVIGKFPSRHARDKGIHHNEFLDFSRKLRGISVSHHQADVVPDHSRFRNAEGVSKRMNSDSGRLHVETVLGNIGFAYAGRSGAITVNLSMSLGIK